MLSLLLPFGAYLLLTRIGRLGQIDAGAVAAHYGSVSVVTFVTAKEIMSAQGLSPAGHMVAVLALMGTPAIISGLLPARRGVRETTVATSRMMAHEVLTNASVVLLIGSIVIGLIAARRLLQAKRLNP